MKGILLTFLALLFFWLLFPFGIFAIFLKKKKGYFDSIMYKVAIEIDELGNLMFQDLFDNTLTTKEGYPFGCDEETISSVLGKNKRDGTLTFLGELLALILNALDPNHVENAIKEKVK